MKGKETVQGKLKSIDENFIKLEIDGKDWNIKYFMPWTTKDGQQKKGLEPGQMEIGKEYKVMCTTFKKPEYDNPLYTAITIFRNDSKPTPSVDQQAEEHEEKQDCINFISAAYADDPTHSEESVIASYFARENPVKVAYLRNEYQKRFL